MLFLTATELVGVLSGPQGWREEDYLILAISVVKDENLPVCLILYAYGAVDCSHHWSHLPWWYSFLKNNVSNLSWSLKVTFNQPNIFKPSWSNFVLHCKISCNFFFSARKNQQPKRCMIQSFTHSPTVSWQQWWWITCGSWPSSGFHLGVITTVKHTQSHVLGAGSSASIQRQQMRASTGSQRQSIQCTSPRLHFQIKIAALLIRLIGFKMSAGGFLSLKTETRFKENFLSLHLTWMSD